MNRIIILSALILLAGCKVDLEEEFGTAVEGSWEIHSITFGESDTTVFFNSPRPRMEFFPCEKNEVMCPLFLFDQEGDMATYEYRGGLSEKDQLDGGINFLPKLFDELEDLNDSIQVFRNFSFVLNGDTLILSDGSINPSKVGEPFISTKASLLLVRER